MASDARMVYRRPSSPAHPSTRERSIEPSMPDHEWRERAGWSDPQRLALAGVAGEGLRSTLALIGGYGQSLLHLALDDDTRRRCTEGLLAAADSLAELTDRILELALSRDGTPQLRRHPVAVDWLAGRLERPGAGTGDLGTVRYLATTDLPFVDVDPLWIGHALRLLVARVRRRAGAGTVVAIHARDAGATVILGIGAEGSAAARQPGVPGADDARPAESGPTEIEDDELALCRWIVEANGGELWLEADGGPGGVTLRLPAQPRSALTAPEPDARSLTSAAVAR